MAKRWQDDPAFVAWMVGAGYAQRNGEKVEPFLSEGLAIYMFEAWTAGRAENSGTDTARGSRARARDLSQS